MFGLLVCVSFSECQCTMQYSHWDILISVSSWNKGAWCRVCYSCLWTETSKHDTGEPLLFFCWGEFLCGNIYSWFAKLLTCAVVFWWEALVSLGFPCEDRRWNIHLGCGVVWCCVVCGVWDDFLPTVSPLLLSSGHTISRQLPTWDTSSI